MADILYGSMNLNTLKEELRKRGAKLSGLKEQIIQRKVGRKFTCKQRNTECDKLKQLILHKVVPKVLKCPLCQYTGASLQQLINHYTIEHSLAVESDTFEFETFEAFQEWKMMTKN